MKPDFALLNLHVCANEEAQKPVFVHKLKQIWKKVLGQKHNFEHSIPYIFKIKESLNIFKRYAIFVILDYNPCIDPTLGAFQTPHYYCPIHC